MKKLIFAFIFFLFLPLGSGFCDTIFFKDGNKLNVKDAWEEGGKIKYKQDDSTVVIYQKADILKVEKNNLIDSPPLNSKKDVVNNSSHSQDTEPQTSQNNNSTTATMSDQDRQDRQVIYKLMDILETYETAVRRGGMTRSVFDMYLYNLNRDIEATLPYLSNEDVKRQIGKIVYVYNRNKHMAQTSILMVEEAGYYPALIEILKRDYKNE